MSPGRKDLLLYLLPPWLWGAAIFAGTSLPSDYLPQIILLSPDKLLHIAAFLVFSILVYRAVRFRNKNRTVRQNISLTTTIAVAYAIFDELHQYFIPGRILDPFDVLADVVGVAAGLVIVVLYQRSVQRRQRHVKI